MPKNSAAQHNDITQLFSFLEEFIKGKVGNPASLNKEIKRLSDNFTKKRVVQNGGYMKKETSRLAYFAFFLPKNILKTYYILSEISLPGGNKRICDIGAGPGTASLGALAFFARESTSVSIDLIDSSRENLDTAIELLENFRQRKLDLSGDICEKFSAEFRAKKYSIRGNGFPLKGYYDLIFFSNSLNEMNVDLLELVRTHLSDDGVLIIIEPALKSTSRAILTLRDEFIKKKLLFPSAPCPNILNCPALASSKDWCHEEKDWNAPSYINKISSVIGINKGTFKYSFLVFRKKPPHYPDGPIGRVVSFPLKEKGRLRFHICCEGKIVAASLAKSQVSSSNEAFMSLSRGDFLSFECVKITGKEMIIRKESVIRAVKLGHVYSN